jgi:MarR family 2-MHQ and catechol resistance regulon transcriptional repressor
VIERWFTSRFTQRQLTDLLTGLHVVRDAVRPDATAGVSDR